jgi:hypothetical protein
MAKYRIVVARRVLETSYQEVFAISPDEAQALAIQRATSDDDADAWESTEVAAAYVMDCQKD